MKKYVAKKDNFFYEGDISLLMLNVALEEIGGIK